MSEDLKLARGNVTVTAKLDHDNELPIEIENWDGETTVYLSIDDMKALRALMDELLEAL